MISTRDLKFDLYGSVENLKESYRALAVAVNDDRRGVVSCADLCALRAARRAALHDFLKCCRSVSAVNTKVNGYSLNMSFALLCLKIVMGVRYGLRG